MGDNDLLLLFRRGEADALETAAKAHYEEEGFGVTFGVFILGYGADMMLLGMMVVQLVTWWPRSKSDKVWLQAAVWWCAALAVAMTIYNLDWMFKLFVYNYGTFSTFFTQSTYSWCIVFDVLTTTVVQLVYAERAYRINRSKVLLTVLLVLIALCVGAAISIRVVSSLYENLGGIFLGFVMVTDLVITVSIMRGLRTTKTGWDDTDRVIVKLIRMSGEVQLPATLVSIAFIIAYALKAICSVDFLCQILQPKVHVVGLLALLNSRDSVRNQLASSVQASNLNSNFDDRGDTSLAIVSDKYFLESRRQPSITLGTRFGEA